MQLTKCTRCKKPCAENRSGTCKDCRAKTCAECGKKFTFISNTSGELSPFCSQCRDKVLARNKLNTKYEEGLTIF